MLALYLNTLAYSALYHFHLFKGKETENDTENDLPFAGLLLKIAATARGWPGQNDEPVSQYRFPIMAERDLVEVCFCKKKNVATVVEPGIEPGHNVRC